MPIDNRVHEMLSLWEQGRAAGRAPAPEELSPDDPELLAELKKNIALLESADQLLNRAPSTQSTMAYMKMTPHSLLARLRRPDGDQTVADHADDETAARQARDWSRFNHVFSPVLCAIADRLCPRDDDAKELISEMYITIRDKIAAGKYDAGKGRFRDWLRVVARNKWHEMLRKRAVRDKGKRELVEEPAVPDNVEEFFQREYATAISARALEILKSEFQPATWHAFTQLVMEERAPADVARDLGMTTGAVYAARFRVLARLRQELAGFLD